jgi:hypothetical protein
MRNRHFCHFLGDLDIDGQIILNGSYSSRYEVNRQDKTAQVQMQAFVNTLMNLGFHERRAFLDQFSNYKISMNTVCSEVTSI